MKIATVFDNSEPVSMMRKHRGMISVVRRKVIVGDELLAEALFGWPFEVIAELVEGSFLTSAPITPSEVRRRYSNGRDLDVVLRNGYRNSGICAFKQVSYQLERKSRRHLTYR